MPQRPSPTPPDTESCGPDGAGGRRRPPIPTAYYETDRPTDRCGQSDQKQPAPPPTPISAKVDGQRSADVDAEHSSRTPELPQHRSSSTELRRAKLRRIHTVDFVLAYKRRRKAEAKEVGARLDDETERRRFYNELRANGILVNVDDDPTCSLDAGRTSFALLRMSRRLLRCRCRCHATSENNGNLSEDEQPSPKDVNHQQHPNENANLEKLTSAQRTQIVWHIILRIGFDNARDARVMSLEKLLEDGIFTAAYPVHDGNIKRGDGEDPNNMNDRRILYEEWARPGLIIPRQLKSDKRITALIQKYYGIPVAVYFCWLRYYTVWLVGPAIAGLVWFLYGLITTRSDVPTRDICDSKSPVAEWVLCPTRQCEAGFCGFTRVLDTCGLYRWTSAATFDRPGAVVFAVFMSFWAAAFQQLWTTHAWQLDGQSDGKTGRDDDASDVCCPVDCAGWTRGRVPGVEAERPGSLVGRVAASPAAATSARRGHWSPTYLSLDAVRRWYATKLVPAAFRAIVFFATLLAVAAVPILIVVYRGRAIGWLMMAVFHQEDTGAHRENAAAAVHHRHHSFFLLNYANSGELSNWKTAVAATCAAFVQLTAIVAVHRGYSAVAEWLTKYSYPSVYDPRFQSRYTAYMSCFDSANYYSSLVYIAFFKGRFVTGGRTPRAADSPSRLSNVWPVTMFRTLVLHVKEDVCDPAAAGTGCVPELCTQLAIIMVGKQLVDNVIELTMPLALNVWRRWVAKESRRRKKMHGKLPDTIVETLKHPKQWQLDYQLDDTGPLGLYQEYSEMVIQYGFVVMFTTAFPLAPLCALLNNVMEQRLDAYKMVAAQRRPVPAYYCTGASTNNARMRTLSCCDNCIKLGTWIRVLKVLSVVSVLYNAFMIAFTSDLLPRYVYSQISSEKTSSLDGYVAWSLSSKRNVSEYYYGQSEDMVNAPDECRYRGYGADADSEHNDYRKWQVLAARLTFVIVFEHGVIAAITGLTYFVRKLVVKYKKWSKTRDGERDDAAAQSNGRGNGTAASSSSVVVVDMENDEPPRAADTRLQEKSENAAAVR